MLRNLPDRDRSNYRLVDCVREYITASPILDVSGDRLTQDNVLDQQTMGDVKLLKDPYVTVLLGDLLPLGEAEIIKWTVNGEARAVARSCQEFSAYIDFINFRDPLTEARIFQAWIYLPEASDAANVVGIEPIRVLSIRDVSFITSGAHERRAQLEMRIGSTIDTPVAIEDTIATPDIRGRYEDQVLNIDVEN